MGIFLHNLCCTPEEAYVEVDLFQYTIERKKCINETII